MRKLNQDDSVPVVGGGVAVGVSLAVVAGGVALVVVSLPVFGGGVSVVVVSLPVFGGSVSVVFVVAGGGGVSVVDVVVLTFLSPSSSSAFKNFSQLAKRSFSSSALSVILYLVLPSHVLHFMAPQALEKSLPSNMDIARSASSGDLKKTWQIPSGFLS